MVNAQDALPITQWLHGAGTSDRTALDQVFARLYPELKRIAHARLYDQGRGDAMQTTALVHESFLKLLKVNLAELQNRHQFFAYAAKVMRHIIVDSARAQLAERRGGLAEHVTLDSTAAHAVPQGLPETELLHVHEALAQLEQVDTELAAVVELRYFGGYSEAEIAQMQGVAERTVRRRWEKARAWLFMVLEGHAGQPNRPAPTSSA